MIFSCKQSFIFWILDARYHPYATPNTSKSSNSSTPSTSQPQDVYHPMTSSPRSSSVDESFTPPTDFYLNSAEEKTTNPTNENYPPVAYPISTNMDSMTGQSPYETIPNSYYREALSCSSKSLANHTFRFSWKYPRSFRCLQFLFAIIRWSFVCRLPTFLLQSLTLRYDDVRLVVLDESNERRHGIAKSKQWLFCTSCIICRKCLSSFSIK